MASPATEEAGATNSGRSERRKLHKAFNQLKSHAAAIANFTLQWQDLEDYVLSIQDQIESSLAQLQSQTPAKLPSDGSTEGKSLLWHLIGLKVRKTIRNYVRHALAGLENCGEVVVEAVREYLHLRNGEGSFKYVTTARRSCTILLNKFTTDETQIEEQVRDDARRLIVEWKERIEKSEANMFLKYMQAYGLVDDFHEDEIFKIFQDILHHKDAPEMLRSLGVGHRAADVIKKLLSLKKGFAAVNFVYEFELVNEFSPASLIKEHLDYMTNEAAVACECGNTAEDSAEAVNLELTALCAAMKRIKTHNLESQFPIEDLTKRIIQLKQHKCEGMKPISMCYSNLRQNLSFIATGLESVVREYIIWYFGRFSKKFAEFCYVNLWFLRNTSSECLILRYYSVLVILYHGQR